MRQLLEVKRDEIVGMFDRGEIGSPVELFDALDSLIDLADANVIEEQPLVAVQVASIDTIGDMFNRSMEQLKTDVLHIVAGSQKATRNPRAPKTGRSVPKKGAVKKGAKKPATKRQR